MGRKSKSQKKKEELEKEIKKLQEQKDNFWSKDLQKIQDRQIDGLKSLEAKVQQGIKVLELAHKKIKEKGCSGYYSSHHDIMEVTKSIYCQSMRLSELKLLEHSIKEIIRKNAKTKENSSFEKGSE